MIRRTFIITALLLGGFIGDTVMAQDSAVAPTDPKNILVLELSTGGKISIGMRPDKAPLHVERVRTLASQGFYNNTIFHRVIDGFMAQAGDPTGTGMSGSKLPNLKAEFNDLPHVRGTVSMARTNDPNSANSQFFIVFEPSMWLDSQYTVWGRVIEGMDAVDAIERGEPPANPTKILKAYMQAQ
jgi:cyclophilin family peptidyl-prolyl cis-trans isomerase